LSITAMFRGAFAAVFGRFWAFVRIASLPFALILSLSLLASFVLVEVLLQSGWGFYVVMVFSLILIPTFPLALLGVSLSRLRLIGPEAARQNRLGRRTWISFGYAAAILIALCLSAAMLSLAIFAARKNFSVIAQIPGITHWMALGGLLCFVALLYGVARLSLLFPAVAVDESLGPAGSWRLTRGHGLKLAAVFGALLLLLVPFALAVPAVLRAADGFVVWLYINVVPVGYHYWPGPPLTDVPRLISILLIACFAVALLTGAAASAYAQLTGRDAPRADILERFE
jgi:hypothetical protein